MTTKFIPAARFEDIGKPFYQTDSRILRVTNFFLDIRSNIKKHRMIIFLRCQYEMWQRKRRFMSLNKDQRKDHIKKLWQLLRFKTKTSMFLKSKIDDLNER